jgi:hypothetical protein
MSAARRPVSRLNSSPLFVAIRPQRETKVSIFPRRPTGDQLPAVSQRRLEGPHQDQQGQHPGIVEA